MFEALVIGAHLATASDHRGYETITPGLYLRADSCLTLGAYRNSVGSRSLYAGCTLQSGPWALTVGAVTGYGRPLAPLVVPSYRWAIGAHSSARIALIPAPPGGAAALHFAVERAF